MSTRKSEIVAVSSDQRPEVNDREHEHPHDIDEVPVVTYCAKRGETTVFEITDKSYTEHDQQGKQTEADVQSVEPSKREKCGGKKIQADGHTALRSRVIKQIGEDQHAEEACFGNDESEDAGFDFVRSKGVDRSSYGNDRIWTIGVRIIPERTSAVNRRERMEILMWRR